MLRFCDYVLLHNLFLEADDRIWILVIIIKRVSEMNSKCVLINKYMHLLNSVKILINLSNLTKQLLVD